MTTSIIWSNPDGSIAITNLVAATDAAKHRDELISKGVFTADQFIAITESLPIPATRYFRQGWRFGGGQITFDLPTCRTVHLQQLRKERDAKLTESDKLLLRLNDLGQDQTALRQYRQTLRDMPADIQARLNSAPNASAIAAVRPTILDVQV